MCIFPVACTLGRKPEELANWIAEVAIMSTPAQVYEFGDHTMMKSKVTETGKKKTSYGVNETELKKDEEDLDTDDSEKIWVTIGLWVPNNHVSLQEPCSMSQRACEGAQILRVSAV